jgi:hypothetical protein
MTDLADRPIPQALADALTGPTVVPLELPVTALTALEAVDVETGDRHEHVDVGPFPDGTYRRICVEDLLVWTDEVRRLLGRIDDVTLEAREHQALLDSHECPGCRTRLAPDDPTCGSMRCNRVLAQETAL